MKSACRSLVHLARRPEAIGPTLGPRRRATPTTAGFDSIWVMDHFFQIRSVGPAEEPMLEGWTALGFMARTRRARGSG
jgi:alkanesulfonate monooxygenase SsuD/methylene tetrahydromethanopterin reductase-like flavin-dependent oxidoreductase (luciferase family)